MRVLKQSEVKSVSGGFLFRKLGWFKGHFHKVGYHQPKHCHPKHPQPKYDHGKGY